MNEIRSLVSARALQSYVQCPQRYAYEYIYELPPHPQTLATRFSLAARRAVMGIARAQASSGSITPKRASMVWQFVAKHYGLDDIPKWSHKGRNIALRFQRHTLDYRVLGVGVEVHLPVQLGPRRTVDIAVTADFISERKGRTQSVLVSEPPLGPIESLVAYRSPGEWHVWSLTTASQRPAKQTTDQTGPIEQALRGMIRKIIWPYYDGRCRTCPYADICKAEDCQPHRLRDESKRERVRQRVKKARSHGSV
jgi:hypothetical protein